MYFHYLDGSVRYAQGNTEILIGVVGPVQPIQSKQEKADKACVEVTFKSRSGQSMLFLAIYRFIVFTCLRFVVANLCDRLWWHIISRIISRFPANPFHPNVSIECRFQCRD
jgi:hypothetical protein